MFLPDLIASFVYSFRSKKGVSPYQTNKYNQKCNKAGFIDIAGVVTITLIFGSLAIITARVLNDNPINLPGRAAISCGEIRCNDGTWFGADPQAPHQTCEQRAQEACLPHGGVAGTQPPSGGGSGGASVCGTLPPTASACGNVSVNGRCKGFNGTCVRNTQTLDANGNAICGCYADPTSKPTCGSGFSCVLENIALTERMETKVVPGACPSGRICARSGTSSGPLPPTPTPNTCSSPYSCVYQSLAGSMDISPFGRCQANFVCAKPRPVSTPRPPSIPPTSIPTSRPTTQTPAPSRTPTSIPPTPVTCVSPYSCQYQSIAGNMIINPAGNCPASFVCATQRPTPTRVPTSIPTRTPTPYPSCQFGYSCVTTEIASIENMILNSPPVTCQAGRVCARTRPAECPSPYRCTQLQITGNMDVLTGVYDCQSNYVCAKERPQPSPKPQPPNPNVTSPATTPICVPENGTFLRTDPLKSGECCAGSTPKLLYNSYGYPFFQCEKTSISPGITRAPAPPTSAPIQTPVPPIPVTTPDLSCLREGRHFSPNKKCCPGLDQFTLGWFLTCRAPISTDQLPTAQTTPPAGSGFASLNSTATPTLQAPGLPPREVFVTNNPTPQSTPTPIPTSTSTPSRPTPAPYLLQDCYTPCEDTSCTCKPECQRDVVGFGASCLPTPTPAPGIQFLTALGNAIQTNEQLNPLATVISSLAKTASTIVNVVNNTQTNTASQNRQTTNLQTITDLPDLNQECTSSCKRGYCLKEAGDDKRYCVETNLLLNEGDECRRYDYTLCQRPLVCTAKKGPFNNNLYFCLPPQVSIHTAASECLNDPNTDLEECQNLLNLPDRESTTLQAADRYRQELVNAFLIQDPTNRQAQVASARVTIQNKINESCANSTVLDCELFKQHLRNILETVTYDSTFSLRVEQQTNQFISSSQQTLEVGGISLFCPEVTDSCVYFDSESVQPKKTIPFNVALGIIKNRYPYLTNEEIELQALYGNGFFHTTFENDTLFEINDQKKITSISLPNCSTEFTSENLSSCVTQIVRDNPERIDEILSTYTTGDLAANFKYLRGLTACTELDSPTERFECSAAYSGFNCDTLTIPQRKRECQENARYQDTSNRSNPTYYASLLLAEASLDEDSGITPIQARTISSALRDAVYDTQEQTVSTITKNGTTIQEQARQVEQRILDSDRLRENSNNLQDPFDRFIGNILADRTEAFGLEQVTHEAQNPELILARTVGSTIDDITFGIFDTEFRISALGQVVHQLSDGNMNGALGAAIMYGSGSAPARYLYQTDAGRVISNSIWANQTDDEAERLRFQIEADIARETLSSDTGNHLENILVFTREINNLMMVGNQILSPFMLTKSIRVAPVQTVVEESVIEPIFGQIGQTVGSTIGYGLDSFFGLSNTATNFSTVFGEIGNFLGESQGGDLAQFNRAFFSSRTDAPLALERISEFDITELSIDTASIDTSANLINIGDTLRLSPAEIQSLSEQRLAQLQIEADLLANGVSYETIESEFIQNAIRQRTVALLPVDSSGSISILENPNNPLQFYWPLSNNVSIPIQTATTNRSIADVIRNPLTLLSQLSNNASEFFTQFSNSNTSDSQSQSSPVNFDSTSDPNPPQQSFSQITLEPEGSTDTDESDGSARTSASEPDVSLNDELDVLPQPRAEQPAQESQSINAPPTVTNETTAPANVLSRILTPFRSIGTAIGRIFRPTQQPTQIADSSAPDSDPAGTAQDSDSTATKPESTIDTATQSDESQTQPVNNPEPNPAAQPQSSDNTGTSNVTDDANTVDAIPADSSQPQSPVSQTQPTQTNQSPLTSLGSLITRPIAIVFNFISRRIIPNSLDLSSNQTIQLQQEDQPNPIQQSSDETSGLNPAPQPVEEVIQPVAPNLQDQLTNVILTTNKDYERGLYKSADWYIQRSKSERNPTDSRIKITLSPDGTPQFAVTPAILNGNDILSAIQAVPDIANKLAESESLTLRGLYVIIDGEIHLTFDVSQPYGRHIHFFEAKHAFISGGKTAQAAGEFSIRVNKTPSNIPLWINRLLRLSPPYSFTLEHVDSNSGGYKPLWRQDRAQFVLQQFGSIGVNIASELTDTIKTTFESKIVSESPETNIPPLPSTPIDLNTAPPVTTLPQFEDPTIPYKGQIAVYPDTYIVLGKTGSSPLLVPKVSIADATSSINELAARIFDRQGTLIIETMGNTQVIINSQSNTSTDVGLQQEKQVVLNVGDKIRFLSQEGYDVLNYIVKVSSDKSHYILEPVSPDTNSGEETGTFIIPPQDSQGPDDLNTDTAPDQDSDASLNTQTQSPQNLREIITALNNFLQDNSEGILSGVRNLFGNSTPDTPLLPAVSQSTQITAEALLRNYIPVSSEQTEIKPEIESYLQTQGIPEQAISSEAIQTLINAKIIESINSPPLPFDDAPSSDTSVTLPEPNNDTGRPTEEISTLPPQSSTNLPLTSVSDALTNQNLPLFSKPNILNKAVLFILNSTRISININRPLSFITTGSTITGWSLYSLQSIVSSIMGPIMGPIVTAPVPGVNLFIQPATEFIRRLANISYINNINNLEASKISVNEFENTKQVEQALLEQLPLFARTARGVKRAVQLKANEIIESNKQSTEQSKSLSTDPSQPFQFASIAGTAINYFNNSTSDNLSDVYILVDNVKYPITQFNKVSAALETDPINPDFYSKIILNNTGIQSSYLPIFYETFGGKNIKFYIGNTLIREVNVTPPTKYTSNFSNPIIFGANISASSITQFIPALTPTNLTASLFTLLDVMQSLPALDARLNELQSSQQTPNLIKPIIPLIRLPVQALDSIARQTGQFFNSVFSTVGLDSPVNQYESSIEDNNDTWTDNIPKEAVEAMQPEFKNMLDIAKTKQLELQEIPAEPQSMAVVVSVLNGEQVLPTTIVELAQQMKESGYKGTIYVGLNTEGGNTKNIYNQKSPEELREQLRVDSIHIGKATRNPLDPENRTVPSVISLDNFNPHDGINLVFIEQQNHPANVGKSAMLRDIHNYLYTQAINTNTRAELLLAIDAETRFRKFTKFARSIIRNSPNGLVDMIAASEKGKRLVGVQNYLTPYTENGNPDYDRRPGSIQWTLNLIHGRFRGSSWLPGGGTLGGFADMVALNTAQTEVFPGIRVEDALLSVMAYVLQIPRTILTNVVHTNQSSEAETAVGRQRSYGQMYRWLAGQEGVVRFAGALVAKNIVSYNMVQNFLQPILQFLRNPPSVNIPYLLRGLPTFIIISNAAKYAPDDILTGDPSWDNTKPAIIIPDGFFAQINLAIRMILNPEKTTREIVPEIQASESNLDKPQIGEDSITTPALHPLESSSNYLPQNSMIMFSPVALIPIGINATIELLANAQPTLESWQTRGPPFRWISSALLPLSNQSVLIRANSNPNSLLNALSIRNIIPPSIRSILINNPLKNTSINQLLLGSLFVPFINDDMLTATPSATPRSTRPIDTSLSNLGVLIDMGPTYDNERRVQTILGNRYNPGNNQQMIARLQSTSDNIALTALVESMFNTRDTHGSTMKSVIRQTEEALGYQDTGDKLVLPLQEAITNVQFGRDQLNNPYIEFSISSQRIANMLTEYFDDNPDAQVINLSLQIGTSRVTQIFTEVTPLPIQTTGLYDEETDEELFTLAQGEISLIVVDGKLVPHVSQGSKQIPIPETDIFTYSEYQERNAKHIQNILVSEQAGLQTNQIQPTQRTETIEQYNPEFAEENLMQLVQLAVQFPDKSFNAAGGNINSHFYQIRKNLEETDNWSDNILIIAGDPEVSDGADIYVNSLGYRRTLSSSEATAIISGIDTILAQQGYSQNERRSLILNTLATPFEFTTHDGTTRTAYHIDTRSISTHPLFTTYEK